MEALAALAVALGVWALVPGGGRRVPGELSGADGRGRTGRRRWVWWAVVLACLAGVALVLGGGALPWLVLGSAVTGTSLALTRHARAARRLRRSADEVARGCQVLASQLRIGQLPTQALAAAADDCPPLVEAVAAQRIGADVAAALRTTGARPGCGGLLNLAAAWQLAERSGAPLAQAAHDVARHLDEVASLRRSVASELAPARATGKLLAFLPVIGIALGFMVGGSPDTFLLRTTIGRWCLAAGTCLACVGVLWTEMLAARVEARMR